MDLGFAAILLGALGLSGLFSLAQHRVYATAAQRLTASHAGRADSFLVSGRGKGWLRGALVLLVIDRRSRSIVAAEAMVGSTVLARFAPRPELMGPIDGAPERAVDPKLQDAVRYALEQYRVTVAAAKKRSGSTA